MKIVKEVKRSNGSWHFACGFFIIDLEGSREVKQGEIWESMMILLRLLPPSCLLLILYLRLVEFPLRWKLPLFQFPHDIDYFEDTATDI